MTRSNNASSAPPVSPIRKRSRNEPSAPRKKPKKQAHVTYVLDRSGSMRQFGDEGFTSVQSTIKELPNIRGADCLVSIFTFDHEHQQIAQSALAKEYELPEEAMQPRGMTALRDALKDAIEFIGTLPQDQEKFLVVFTDGVDNISKITTKQIAVMIKELKNVDITWLAAAQADMQTAEHLGINTEDVLKVGSTGDNMATAMRSSSLKSNEGFSQAQRQASIQ